MANQEKVNQYISLIFLVSLGGMIAWGLVPFLQSFLGAIVLYFLMKPPMNWLMAKWGFSPKAATVLLLLISFLLVLLPTVLIVYSLVNRASDYLAHPEIIWDQVMILEKYLSKKLKLDLFSDHNLEMLRGTLTGYLSGFLSQTMNLLANIGIMYFIVFFMLVNSNEMELQLLKLLPYGDDKTLHLKAELQGHIYSNVIVAPLLSIIQGVFASLVFWIVGLQEPFFWGTICGIFSFIPFVGSALIWVPAGIYLLVNGSTWQGVWLLLSGLLLISNVDNVFRFVLQKKFADVHPIVTVLGVIIGLYWFGFTGIIFGPVLISFFQILLKSYRQEYILTK